MRSVRFSLGVVLISVGSTSACSPPQEPWVSDTEQLRQERYLSPDKEKTLRERVIRSQRDR